MTNIIIYTTTHCPYCVKAKNLLNKKQIEFKEIDITDDQARQEMITKSGGKKTVPQIFINNQNIGGYDDLYELEKQDKLDDLLKINKINL
jgi:glutaredoxin 3